MEDLERTDRAKKLRRIRRIPRYDKNNLPVTDTNKARPVEVKVSMRDKNSEIKKSTMQKAAEPHGICTKVHLPPSVLQAASSLRKLLAQRFAIFQANKLQKGALYCERMPLESY